MSHPALSSLLQVPPLPDVARELIVDFDFFAVQPIDGDLHQGWKRLHDGPEIFYTPRNSGHWVVTRARDIEAVFRDHENFSNAGVAMSREPREMLLAPGEIDPPLHTGYRILLNPWFGPKPMRALEDEARRLAGELIDGFRAQGRCEFRESFSHRMPIYVFLSLMKLPREDAETLVPAADLLSRDPDPASFLAAMQAMMSYLHGRIAERTAAPRDDFISAMLASEVDGRPVQPHEVLSLTANVMFGGLDTVTSTMGFFMNFLARHPGHVRQLVDEPALIPAAVDELLRRHAIANFGRMVKNDMDYGGMPMRAGDLVLMPTALYNLDERRFPDPMTVDFKRADKAHFNFGGGIHRCLGLQLARLELRVMLEEWLERIPVFRIADGERIRATSGRINAMSYLPLSW